MNSCAICGFSSTLKCSACKSITYCSVEHQKQGWKQHKADCKKWSQHASATTSSKLKSLPCPLLNLVPHDILLLLADYLLPEKERNKDIFKFSLDWQHFMNCNKSYFQVWKKKTQIIELNRLKSAEFMASAKFRERILRTIDQPHLQLRLEMVRPEVMLSSQINKKHYDLSALSNIQKIVIHDCNIESFSGELENVEEFACYTCGFKDLKFVSKVKDLFFESRLNNHEFDLACLTPQVEILSFRAARVKSYEHLTFLQKVSFTFCDSIEDVSCFRSVPSVNLSYCSRISDVSMLGGCHTLNISHCPRIREVSALGKVYDLNLSDCPQITNISALGEGVHTLDLTGCSGIQDLSTPLPSVVKLTCTSFSGSNVSGLINVKVLDLAHSKEVIDISYLRSVEDLNIMGCEKVSNITMLSNVKKLDISYCPLVNDFTGLDQLEELIVRTRPGREFTIHSGFEIFTKLKRLTVGAVKDPSSFLSLLRESVKLEYLRVYATNLDIKLLPRVVPNLPKLKISDCNNLIEVPSFPRLQSLEIENCRGLRSLNEDFPCLGNLLIHLCPNITLLKIGKGRVQVKEQSPLYNCQIYDCDNLKEIQLFRKISDMDIASCENLKRITNSHFMNHYQFEGDADQVQLR